MPITKKPILMVCNRSTRSHTPSELPLPALSHLPAGSPTPSPANIGVISAFPPASFDPPLLLTWKGITFCPPLTSRKYGFHLMFDLKRCGLTCWVTDWPIYHRPWSPSMPCGLQACLSLAVTATGQPLGLFFLGGGSGGEGVLDAEARWGR